MHVCRRRVGNTISHNRIGSFKVGNPFIKEAAESCNSRVVRKESPANNHVTIVEHDEDIP